MDWISNGMLSELLTMAKSADTMSTKSSIISGKAVSLNKTVKKGTKVITRPFKKFRQSCSIRSAAHSTSRSSMAFPSSDHEANSDNDKSITDNGSGHGSSEPEVEFTPQQELGLSSFYLLCDVMLIIYFRGAQKNLALAHLFILQTRCHLAALRRSTMPSLYLCCSKVQGV